MGDSTSYFKTATAIFNIDGDALEPIWAKGEDISIEAFVQLDQKQSYYLHEGIVREYFVDKKGVEHTTKFIQGPTLYNPNLYRIYRDNTIELISQTLTPFKGHRLDFDFTMVLIKKDSLFLRVTINAIINSIKVKVRKDIRRNANTAEERYRLFTQEFLGAVNLIPLKFIASYLNISPETVSRIRNHYSKQ